MVSPKFCPNCGNEIDGDDVEFCTQCGYDLTTPKKQIPKGFFAELAEKTSFPILIFSFIIFGIFLFVGSVIWSLFISNVSMDLITYIILTVVFSVFFGGIFTGYFGCMDKSYLIPNFSMYLGSIFAVVLCGIGLIFTFLNGIISALSSFFKAASSYGNSYQSSVSSLTSFDLSIIFKIILFILLIPVAAYAGVYVGYLLKEI